MRFPADYRFGTPKEGQPPYPARPIPCGRSATSQASPSALHGARVTTDSSRLPFWHTLLAVGLRATTQARNPPEHYPMRHMPSCQANEGAPRWCASLRPPPTARPHTSPPSSLTVGRSPPPSRGGRVWRCSFAPSPPRFARPIIMCRIWCPCLVYGRATIFYITIISGHSLGLVGGRCTVPANGYYVEYLCRAWWRALPTLAPLFA